MVIVQIDITITYLLNPRTNVVQICVIVASIPTPV